MELLHDVNWILDCVIEWHDEIENIEYKIMATLRFGLEMVILFDNLVINVNVVGFGTCPNLFGVCRIKGKPSVNLTFRWRKDWDKKWFDYRWRFLNWQWHGLHRWFLGRQRRNFHQRFLNQQLNKCDDDSMR